ncbi:MAG TPA: WecB/TagA/CpsF family glycosyltransferase [Gemmataceae bacterium]|jgi:N-acetylglucosaminyldiphosphoundecaprenol N-acetyl-beta-D-mannosaminyltransferase
MTADASEPPPPVEVWGLPLAPLTLPETVALIDRWVADRTPRYVITANVHYAMLAANDPRLGPVTRGAALVLADGMPLVWAARGRLPERVAGSDLVPALCRQAADRGHRVFLLGAAPGVAEQAAANLRERFPGVTVAGTLAPPFRDLSAAETDELIRTVRDARPDLLFVAFGQPKGELWVAEHYRALGAPVTMQVGATLDFLAGRVSRAPRWVQRVGLEWAYRLLREPRRLAGRYLSNGLFVARMVVRRG